MNEVLPADVLIPVSGGREVGARLASHPDIDKVMFTGSTATGRKIIESSAGNLARLTLELGGNDAGIVLPGTDPAAIAENLFWGAFINTGQTCAALKRLYVHDSIYDEVVDALAEVAGGCRWATGSTRRTCSGRCRTRSSSTSSPASSRTRRQRGGRVVTGGAPAPELGELFYPITLVADVDDGDPPGRRGAVRPGAPDHPLQRRRRGDRAARTALDAGLGASVWSADPDAARTVAERLEAGTVWINSHGGVHPMMPFGGVKGSGYGLEFGVEGLKSRGGAAGHQRLICGSRFRESQPRAGPVCLRELTEHGRRGLPQSLRHGRGVRAPVEVDHGDRGGGLRGHAQRHGDR